ncbi:hypothetical protein [Marinobacter qingdaonensis]|uniref:Pyocin activator protein PrtN n=1 Tax=Marinobacter qingdaonensis TaxID=3108486 RepID=A0ABU5P1N2_9GAMM|nr:hypothetical protein [Marinobacter sp. ASW11-75]MEA1081975.1 hypothetical protein [Marinobacter sp. ASW11-75]
MTVDQFILTYPDHPLAGILKTMYIPGHQDFVLLKGAAVGMVMLAKHEKLFPDSVCDSLMDDLKPWESTRPRKPKPNEIN